MITQKRVRSPTSCSCPHAAVVFIPPAALPLHHTSPYPRLSPRLPPFCTPRLPRLYPHHLPPAPFIHSLRPTSATATPFQQNLADVDPRVLSAVSSLARQDRLTIPDVAAAAGVPLALAQDQVVSLAALTGAAIDVTDAGLLAYRFPRDVRAKLRRSSVRAALRMGWERVFPTLFTAVRVAFGGLLILSIVVTFLALAALASASRSDDDRRDSRSSAGGGFLPVRLFAPDIFDVMFYTRRRRSYAPARRVRGGRVQPGQSDMSFLEAVYSFVFGDGDANEGLEERRWRRVAAIIRANRGAVTAEQLAPFLDIDRVPGASADLVDESYVLPVLQRFHGHPEVTDDGDIIYVFPSFADTGARAPTIEFAGRGAATLEGAAGPALVEKELELSRASSKQRALVIALGVVNVLGVLALGANLASVRPMSQDAMALVSLLRSVFPALALYAASFVAIPLARRFRQRRVNAKIRARNAARAAASVKVARPDMELRRKLKATEKYGQSARVVGGADVVYSSDVDAQEQGGWAEDFDRRLNGRGGRREG